MCRRNNKAYAAVGSVPAVAAGAYNYPYNYGTAGQQLHHAGHRRDRRRRVHGDAALRERSAPLLEHLGRVVRCADRVGRRQVAGLRHRSATRVHCQAGYDSTHLYPRFYQFGATSYVDNYANAAFQRVDLDISQRATATYTTTWIDASGQQQTITRSFDEEMTNYANWFAYYRTRVQAVKTVTSLVFNQLDDTYNVGFHTLVERR